jgi:hypothetical protein
MQSKKSRGILGKEHQPRGSGNQGGTIDVLPDAIGANASHERILAALPTPAG